MSYFFKQPECFEQLGKLSKSITLDYRTLRNREYYTVTFQCARKKLQLEEAVKVLFNMLGFLSPWRLRVKQEFENML